ncbi:hypothetical protein BpHYR1_014723 [Brachionus plicatilis]|uniref:Uncharacterized protein n=1 Tax=Brachionus plicatilis TaxID=10195 RepID=A0A3M7T6Y3_BRAPC|nr:hypothetical protein BpHYR1_014723 [Brachionus plicatilis]
MADKKDKLTKIELTLIDPSKKADIRLDDLLIQMDIGKSTVSVSYDFTESDLVKKLILIFESKDNAEKFKDYLDIESNMEVNNFGHLETREIEEKFKIRRFSSCSTDSFQLINEDNHQEFITAIPGDGASFNYCEESLMQSSMSESIYKNNTVEFYFDKEIQDKDLDIILLFLENLRKSGGGEYLNYELDPKKRLLNVEYKNGMNKSKTLDKKLLKIKINSIEYNITANEPLDTNSFELNKMVIILRNIQESWINDEIVNLYAENLVINDDETNDIVGIVKSSIFPNTVYVKYKHNFDLDLIKKRYDNRNSITNVRIGYLAAYRSKIVLVRLYDKNMKAISKDLIEMYFMNRRRCGSEPYLSIHEREPFLLLSYDTQAICEAICSRTHRIGEYELLVECLYNYQLFDENLKELGDLIMKNLTVESQQNLEPINEQELKKSKSQETKKEQELKEFKSQETKKEQEIKENKIQQDQKLKKEQKFNQFKGNEHQELKEVIDKKRVESVDTNNNQANKKFEENDTKNAEPQVKKALPKVEFRKPFFKTNSKKEPKIFILKIFDYSLEEDLAKKLEDCQSSFELKLVGDTIELFCECTHDLPSGINEYKEIKLKWEKDIENLINSFFEQFKIENALIKYPSIVEEKVNFDKIKVKLIKKDDREQNSQYIVAGFADDVQKLMVDIQREDVFVPPVMEEPVMDQIAGLELYQIRILFVVKYIKTLKEKYPSMTVSINHRQLKVALKGKPSEIAQAKDLCREILSKIKFRDLPFEQIEIKFFAKKEIEVVNWLKENHFECVLMKGMQTDLMRIYFIDLEKAKDCIKELKNEITSREVNKELREGISDEYIDEFIQRHSNDDRVYLELDGSAFYISGFKSSVEDLFHEFLSSIIN